MNGKPSAVQAERNGTELKIDGPSGKLSARGLILPTTYWDPATVRVNQLLDLASAPKAYNVLIGVQFCPLPVVVHPPFHLVSMEGQAGMICVETIGMVRRYYLVEKKSIKEICRVLNLSRERVRKIVRSETTAFTYERQMQPYSKLGPWITRLDKLPEENQELPRKQRRRMARIRDQLVREGYDSVRRHARTWRIRHDKNKAAAFIPLILDPGEACQFDWSEEKLLMGGSLVTVQVAHVKLSHSRMPSKLLVRVRHRRWFLRRMTRLSISLAMAA